MKTPQMFHLTGKVALVTGGSRSIGLDIARGLGEAGARIAIISRTASEVEAAAEQLRSEGIEAIGFAHNLAELDRMSVLVDRVVAELGDIDILVNNAAISFVSSMAEHTIEDWRRVMDINANSVAFLTQEVGTRCMIPRRTGKIVNFTSIGGMGGTAIDGPFLPAYSASKAAVIGFTRALATEWGRFGINVNVIAPGNFPSAMTEYTLPAEHKQRVLMKTPLGRTGGRDDMKGVALFLASEASRHVTGHLIPVDGGLTAVNYSSLPSTSVPLPEGWTEGRD